MKDVEQPDKGTDGFGQFKFTRYAKCGVCGKGRPYHGRSGKNLCVIYTGKPKVSPYVADAASLLLRNKKTKKFIRTVGINCGCYAKVHRQIAHIENANKEHAGPPRIPRAGVGPYDRG